MISVSPWSLILILWVSRAERGQKVIRSLDLVRGNIDSDRKTSMPREHAFQSKLGKEKINSKRKTYPSTVVHEGTLCKRKDSKGSHAQWKGDALARSPVGEVTLICDVGKK